MRKMAGGKGKKKSGKAAAVINDVNPLLTVSDFSDFQDFACQDSDQDDLPKEIDSDTENAIYAQMYFNTSGDVAFANLFDHGSKVAVVGVKKNSVLGDTDNGEGSGCLPGSETSDGLLSPASTQNLIHVPQDPHDEEASRESSLSQSPEDILEISFKKNDPEQKKKKRKKKKRKMTSTMAGGDDTVDESDNMFPHIQASCLSLENEGRRGNLEPGGAGLDEAEEPYIIIEDEERPSSNSYSSSPEVDIRYLFDSAKKSSKHRPKQGKSTVSSPGDGDRSSLELGEIATSGDSTPNRKEGSADMDLCSTENEAEDDDADPWKISEKDKLGRDAYDRLHGYDDNAGRYYGLKNGAKCRNCKQKGHNIQKCPWPKRPTVCYLCAKTGHVSGNCPQSLCSYCYMRKHRGRPCSVLYNIGTQCVRCHMSGHQASVCPDQWRQYHHTLYEHSALVDNGLGRRRTDKRNIYCSNCSRKGHFGFECTIPVARGVPRHHLPLVAHHDSRVWPPRDARSHNVIQHALQTRLPFIPHPFPPDIQLPTTTTAASSNTVLNPAHVPHSLEVHGQKRTLEEASEAASSTDQLQNEEARPPPQKRQRNRRQSRSSQSVGYDSSLSNDMEAISSDEFDDSDSQNPNTKGKSKYNGRERKGSHGGLLEPSPSRPQFLDSRRHSDLTVDRQHSQYKDTYMDHSFSHSPFTNMHGRQVHMHSGGSSSSSATPMNDHPFPRTPHNYEDSPGSLLRQHSEHDYRRSSDVHRRSSLSSHRHSMDYSTGDSRPHWMDSPQEKRLPLLNSPPQTPSFSPRSPPFAESAPPSRSHSGGFRQPHPPPPPPAYHRRFSEPASHRSLPSRDDSTPASRRNYRQDRQYTTSNRGFRMSNQRVADIKERYRNNNSNHGRRHSSDYNRF